MRFFAVLMAVLTYVMRGFAACFLGLQGIDEHSWGKTLKLVSLLLSVPFFHLSHLFL